jgi:hypothetical protein
MYYTNNASTLVASTNLTQSPPSMAINNPTSTRYAYGIWFYMNTWDTASQHIIFSISNSLVLYLDANTPTLYCDVVMSDKSIQTVTITNNFPIQKWTHIIISMDNQFMDIYMNGKLLMSQRLYKMGSNGANTIPAAPGKDAQATVGGGLDTKWTVESKPSKNSNAATSYDAFVTKFKRWTDPMDPNTAWTTYVSGSGNSFSTNTYNLSMNLLKNNVQTSTFTLF